MAKHLLALTALLFSLVCTAQAQEDKLLTNALDLIIQQMGGNPKAMEAAASKLKHEPKTSDTVENIVITYTPAQEYSVSTLDLRDTHNQWKVKYYTASWQIIKVYFTTPQKEKSGELLQKWTNIIDQVDDASIQVTISTPRKKLTLFKKPLSNTGSEMPFPKTLLTDSDVDYQFLEVTKGRHIFSVEILK